MARAHRMLVPALLLLVASCDGGKTQPTASASSRSALTDTDGDGVSDLDDFCPGSPPLPEATNPAGCPDQDMDGVQDTEDECPATPRDTPVNEIGCPINDPRDGFGAELYDPRFVSEATRKQVASDFIGAFPDNCEDDHVGPDTPVVQSPAIWSVEFRRPWNPGETVPITFSPVQDSCAPVWYGIEVQRRAFAPGSPWETVVDERRLATPSLVVRWDVNGWGRYRVFARDNNGHRSPTSSWRYFTFPGPDIPPEDHLILPPSPDHW